MEIINLHSWLLKMSAMRKFNVHSSDRKIGKVIVNFACVYHYCSYLRLPLPPRGKPEHPSFFKQLFFFFKATNEKLCLLAMSCLTS